MTNDWIRPIGSTGLTASAICVGATALGANAETHRPDEPDPSGVELVGAVFASPLRSIDTSNNYVDGDSERTIGAAIAKHGLPADFLVMTKADGKNGDFSGNRLHQSVRESKERLGLDHLPLVHLHDAENFGFDDLTSPGGAVDTLVRLRDAGEIGHIGLAGGSVHEMSRYLALGVFEVLLVHNRWTLVDRSATEIIEQARELDVAVFNAAVLGGGILANPHGATSYGYEPAPPALLEAVEKMSALCSRYGTDLATAAIQFSLRDPRMATTIVGIRKPARIKALMAAADARLPDDLWPELETLLPARENWLDFRPR